MNWTISSIGLNEYEEGLIQGHLKILNAKTQNSWHYTGTKNNADLVISKRPLSTRARVALLAEDGYRKVNDDLYYLGESLRIFSFLELLLDIEQGKSAANSEHFINQHQTNTAQTLHDFIHNLADSDSFEVLAHQQPCCLMFVEQDEWKAISTLSKNELVDTLISQSVNFRDQCSPLEALSLKNQGGVRISIKELLWELSVKNPQEHPTDTGLFKLSSWPLLGSWYTEPFMMRLAALYSRKFASVDDGVRFTGASAGQVQAFLTACQLCDLGVERRNSVDHQKPEAQRQLQPASANRSLLKKLRKKLGMAFGNE